METEESKTSFNPRLKEIIPKSGAHLLDNQTYSTAFLYKNFLLFFKGKIEEFTTPGFMVFNLDNSEWSTLIPKGRTPIDQPLDFSVCAYGKNKIVLYGREPTYDQNDRNDRNDRANTPRRRGSRSRSRSGKRSRSKSPRYRNNEPCCRILNIVEDSGPKAREIGSAPFEAEWEVFSSREMVYRQNHTAHVYGDRLIVFGGLDNRLQPMGSIVSYDLKNPNQRDRERERERDRDRERFERDDRYYRNEYRQDPNRITPRYSHSGVMHQDKIYYYGGIDQEGNTLYDMWTYNLRNNDWQQVVMKGLIPTPRASCLAQVSGDTILFLNGICNFVEHTELLAYDINANTWNVLDDKISLDTSSKAFAMYQNTPIIAKGFKLYSFQTGKSYKNIKPSTSSDSSFKSNDRQLFTNKPFHDITFNVEGTLIPAHKALLASRSSHFRNMFQSGMKESNSKVIDFPEMSLSIFNGFLEYIYCGEVKELTESVAVELLKVADKYAVTGLRDLSEQFLVDKLGIDNVVDLTNLADLCGANNLFEAGLSFMAENFEEVFKKHDIKSLSSTTLVQLFEQK